MQNRLNHRGPDDRGSFVSSQSRFALAHTRLSILDLSAAAAQPMESMDGRYWIAFNGEIYNYRELRREIELRHQSAEIGGEQQIRGGLSQIADSARQRPAVGSQLRWRSNSDTEVLLNAFRIWGTESLEKLRGMFALAIWDEQERKLFLARDPFGIKPLYYYRSEDTILFASEMRALLASRLVPRKISQEGLSSYLRYGSVQDPLTIIDGINTIPPGRVLTVDCKQPHPRIETSLSATYKSPNSWLPPVSDRSEAVDVLREVLRDSVRMQLRSDVPIGTFLSGGIDSSALVALISTVADQVPKTFSVVFPERDFSEAVHARHVAELFGAEHHEIVLSEHGLLRLLPDALKAMDRPTMDGINTYVISKAVRESGITVALSGLGGDELFGGYPSFRRVEQAQRLALLPDAFRKRAAHFGHLWMNGSTRRSKLWDLIGSDLSACSVYRISRRLFAPDEIRALVPNSCPGEESSCALNVDPINVIAEHELTGYMTHTLLRDTDQMSMAHGLEIRVPFIDPVVVSHVMRLPGKWKVEKNRPKALLLDTVGNLLPDEIWHRPKMGFTLPFSRWMTSALAPELNQVFSNPGSFSKLGIESSYARRVWSVFQSNPRDEPWSRSWALYALKRWCDENDVTAG
jgi:asparagine synthase (glutamine-hydrolysing)